jgi:hypothetical protein
MTFLPSLYGPSLLDFNVSENAQHCIVHEDESRWFQSIVKMLDSRNPLRMKLSDFVSQCQRLSTATSFGFL